MILYDLSLPSSYVVPEWRDKCLCNLKGVCYYIKDTSQFLACVFSSRDPIGSPCGRGNHPLLCHRDTDDTGQWNYSQFWTVHELRERVKDWKCTQQNRRVTKSWPDGALVPVFPFLFPVPHPPEPAVLPGLGTCQISLQFPVGIFSSWQTEEPWLDQLNFLGGVLRVGRDWVV